MASKIEELKTIMARLRDPETGCPWDVEQNFASIAPCTLAEAYEVLDAIEKNDMESLKEELGDLLLQVIFHSQMASEENKFNFEDVVASIINKLITRHPHVFGDAEISMTAKMNRVNTPLSKHINRSIYAVRKSCLIIFCAAIGNRLRGPPDCETCHNTHGIRIESSTKTNRHAQE